MLPELLLAAKPAASPALRERVRLIAAAEPQPPRRLPRRRIALAMSLAVVLAAAAAGLAVGLSGHGSGGAPVEPVIERSVGATARPGVAPAVLPSTPSRLQDYRAHLELQVPTAAALSDRTKRAMRIGRRLGGVVTKVDFSSQGRSGSALIVLRVPIARVQDAIAELSGLGRIVNQQVVIVDVERRIEALRKRVQESTGEAKETAQAQLQRELRNARLSTVAVGLSTPPVPVPVPVQPQRESTAVRILEAEGRIALYTALIAGPILLVGAAIWLVVRALRRRAERRLLDA
jgi:hypothetical protein